MKLLAQSTVWVIKLMNFSISFVYWCLVVHFDSKIFSFCKIAKAIFAAWVPFHSIFIMCYGFFVVVFFHFYFAEVPNRIPMKKKWKERERERAKMIHEMEWYKCLPVAGSNIHIPTRRGKISNPFSIWGGQNTNWKEKRKRQRVRMRVRQR